MYLSKAKAKQAAMSSKLHAVRSQLTGQPPYATAQLWEPLAVLWARAVTDDQTISIAEPMDVWDTCGQLWLTEYG